MDTSTSMMVPVERRQEPHKMELHRRRHGHHESHRIRHGNHRSRHAIHRSRHWQRLSRPKRRPTHKRQQLRRTAWWLWRFAKCNRKEQINGTDIDSLKCTGFYIDNGIGAVNKKYYKISKIIYCLFFFWAAQNIASANKFTIWCVDLFIIFFRWQYNINKLIWIFICEYVNRVMYMYTYYGDYAFNKAKINFSVLAQ